MERNTPPPDDGYSGPLWPWVVGGAVVLFVGFGFVSGNSPEGKAKDADRAAIRQCWEESKRASLPPSAARLAAGACEGMEASFRTRFGVAP
jgi:hypothetical protein